MIQPLLMMIGWMLCAVGITQTYASLSQPPAPTSPIRYSVRMGHGDAQPFLQQLHEWQLQVLEKLNRCDLQHLPTLEAVVTPETWVEEELRYSPLPLWYPTVAQQPKVLLVHQPAQVFGGYEYGRLVRWGPVSTGRKNIPTPSGLFYLNWKSQGRRSTVNPEWFMPWYFNFHNQQGLSFHEYSLPGYPASHACIRLLSRDAQWLYQWGEEWRLGATGRTVLQQGTPVLILGAYDFAAPPPWRSLEWLATGIVLPAEGLLK